MRVLTLTPADSFFFKGHMMSEMGTPSQWSSCFPTRPNTVYGALRSAYIHRYSNFDEFRLESDPHTKEWMGSPTTFGTFRQMAVLIKQGEDILLPIPMDYRIKHSMENGKEILQATSLKLIENNVMSNANAKYTLVKNNDSEREGKDVDRSGKFTSLQEWRRNVMNQEQITQIHSLKEIVDTYTKTGIKINQFTRKAEDSHFFQMNMMNMQEDCSLVSLVPESPDFSDVPYVSLGAENRPWFVKQDQMEWSIWTDEQLLELEEMLLLTGIARIILLTPLVLPENCSLINPSLHDDCTWSMTPGVDVELLTWVTERSELYGGWDIVGHRPKPRVLMLPAGTVFYVRVQPQDISKIVALANGFTLFPGETEGRDIEGFGFAVIAGMKHMDNN